jgi:pimeloyl-ACP methyl ester carboxylesterase
MALPVVLVHGGGHGAWCWARVLDHLDADALAVDLPPTAVRGGPDRFADLPELRKLTVGDFATSVLADADAAGYDRFVLVGHSLAGVTIPEVARRAPARVAHLVFLSCTIPAEGGSTLDRLHDEVAAMARENLAQARTRPPTGERGPAPMPDEVLRHMFGTDLDDAAMQLVLDHFGNEAMGVIDEVVSRVGVPPETPKTWIRLLRDATLSVADQDASIAYLEESPGGPVTVVDIDTGHDAMLSRPAEVAAVIDRIATAAT